MEPLIIFKRKKYAIFLFEIVVLSMILFLALKLRFLFLAYSIPPGYDPGYHITMSKLVIENWAKFNVLPLYDPYYYGGMPYRYAPGLHLLAAFLSFFLNLNRIEIYKYLIYCLNSFLVLSVFLLARKIGGSIAGLTSAFLIAITPTFFTLYYGFYAEELGTFLMPLAFYFVLKKKLKIAIFAFSFLLLSHPLTFSSLMFGIISYYYWRCASSSTNRFFKLIFDNVREFVLLIIGILCLSSWWLTIFLYPVLYNPLPRAEASMYQINWPILWRSVPFPILIMSIVGIFALIITKKDFFIITWLAIVVYFMLFSRWLLIGELKAITGRPERLVNDYGVILVILSGIGIKWIIDLIFSVIHNFFRNQDIANWKFFLFLILFVPIVLYSTITITIGPGRIAPTISQNDIKAMIWIKNNTSKDAVIVTLGTTGYWLPVFAERKTVVGGYVLPSTRASERIYYVDRIYSGSVDEQTVISFMRRHDAEYIYSRKELKSLTPEHFKLVYKRGVRIYQLHPPPSFVEASHSALVLGDPLYVIQSTKFLIETALIWGPKKIDALNINDLLKYDALILYNYDYDSESKANLLLREYLANGGNILVDCYNSPPILGIKPMQVAYYGEINAKVMLNHSIFNGINISNFSPAIWEGDVWNCVVYPGYEGDVLLRINHYPAIRLLNKGKGKIMLLGFNLFYHAEYYRNDDEKRLLANMIDWLANVDMPLIVDMEVLERSPTSITVKVNASTTPISVVTKVPYYPGWTCEINGASSEIGDCEGYITFNISEKGVSIVKLKYEKSFIHSLGSLLSTISLIILLMPSRITNHIALHLRKLLLDVRRRS